MKTMIPLGYHAEWNLGSPGGWDYQRMAPKNRPNGMEKDTSHLRTQHTFGLRPSSFPSPARPGPDAPGAPQATLGVQGLLGMVSRFGGIPTNVGWGGGNNALVLIPFDTTVRETVETINRAIVKTPFHLLQEVKEEMVQMPEERGFKGVKSRLISLNVPPPSRPGHHGEQDNLRGMESHQDLKGIFLPTGNSTGFPFSPGPDYLDKSHGLV